MTANLDFNNSSFYMLGKNSVTVLIFAKFLEELVASIYNIANMLFLPDFIYNLTS